MNKHLIKLKYWKMFAILSWCYKRGSFSFNSHFIFLRTRLLHHRLHAEKSQVPTEKQTPQQVHRE